jgi:hypothetical protein
MLLLIHGVLGVLGADLLAREGLPPAVIPPLLAGKIVLWGKPLNFRRGTRLPQPGGGQAGVPACRSTGGTAGRSPVERHGQDAHATSRHDEALPLFLSAALRLCVSSPSPPRKCVRPRQ